MDLRVSLNQAWRGKADCLNCSIRSSALFSGLTEEDFQQLHQPVDQLTISSGDTLYRVGDAGQNLFTIRTGLVKLVQYLPDGTKRIVRLAAATDVLGLEVMVGEKYEHDVIALQTTELCRYPVEAVHRLSQRNKTLHKDLMARWQKALTEADAWLTQLSTGSAKKRMANLLLRLINEEATDCHLFSREDIGSILSMTTETASRTISEFKRLNLMKEISHNHYDLDTLGLKSIISD